MGSAVLRHDELDEEEVEDHDEGDDGEPEEGGQRAPLVAVAVQGDEGVVVGGRWGGGR